MRLAYIFAIVVAATFQPASAFSPVKDSKAVVKNGATPATVTAQGGRLLRGVDNAYDSLDGDDDDSDLDDDDLDGDFDEERGLGDTLKKLNPVTAVKKSVKQTAKAKQMIKDAVEYQKMIEKAKELVYKN
ncbi:hypothetical protein P3T76_015065 [Phytophthora citrophthora]|uniref:RxLR effector protein n=1 Tax=Phytophthora citrophthora TaxID=4793 RepID=A0AAD9LBG1_9STRA|nr:hypothetical protein P3T76_015065 [Phytophthora citrophthora]